MMNMSGARTVLISGGAGGIGAAIARRLAGDGHRVVIADLDEGAAAAVAGSLRRSKGAARALGVDVTNERSVANMFERFDREHGPLHSLVNCAGVSPRIDGRRPFVEETPLDV